MSRIGKMPVVVPAGVEVKIGADVIEVKGPKGQISTPVCNLLSYEMKDGHIILARMIPARATLSMVCAAPFFITASSA